MRIYRKEVLYLPIVVIIVIVVRSDGSDNAQQQQGGNDEASVRRSGLLVNDDRLDFHDVAVWAIRAALEAAYAAGVAAAVKH